MHETVIISTGNSTYYELGASMIFLAFILIFCVGVFFLTELLDSPLLAFAVITIPLIIGGVCLMYFG